MIPKPFLTVLITCLVFLPTVDAAPVNEEPIDLEVLSEGSDGFSVALNFREPTLIAGKDAQDAPLLRVDLPGTVPEFEREGPALPSITRLVAVPDGYAVRAWVRNIEENLFDVEPVIPRDRMSGRTLRRVVEPPVIEVGKPGWMRWLRVAPVVIRPARYLSDEHNVSCAGRIEIEFEFVPDNSSPGRNIDPERYWSLAFEEFFQAYLLNPGSLGHILPGGRAVQRGSYLIITNPYLAAIVKVQEFAEWKRRKGFHVVIEDMYREDINASEIKEYIQEAYDEWDRPPEYVLLLGDVNRAGIELPTFYIENSETHERDATDQPYVFLNGDDYFMDAFIGRISSDSPNPGELQVAMPRYITHERDLLDLIDQNQLDPDAFHRATVFGGNYGQSGRHISSPVETCRWLAARLCERGFEVDTFFYERPGDNIDSDPIVESINRCVNIVAYRGWADARGTHYPQFYYNEDFPRLDNGPLLPIFTFFVCNVGDFDNRYHRICFGEYSLLKGTRRSPKVALAFYGPSDLYTQTMFNNPMLAGFYAALLYKNIRVFGSLTLSAKMEIWRSFPHKQRPGDLVEFYTHVYNILGDPEVNLYLDPPYRLIVDHPNQLWVGDTYTLFTVSNSNDNPVRGALITLRKEDETEISVQTDSDGEALIPIRLDTEGELEVTVIAHQAGPYLVTIPVQAAGRNISFAGVTVEGHDVIPTGTAVELTVTLSNTGNTLVRDVHADLSSALDEVEIIRNRVEFGDIPAGETAVGDSAYCVILSHAIPSKDLVPFQLDITDGDNFEYRALFRLPINTGVIQYQSHEFENEFIDPGETSDLTVTVINAGGMDLSGLTAELHYHGNAVNLVDTIAFFGDLAAGDAVSCSDDPFRIEVEEGVFEGRQVHLFASFYDPNELYVNEVHFNIVIGEVGSDDPIGPDGYGYYAYEDIDDSDRYPQAPTYEWIELDPDHDGEGADYHKLSDDTTIVRRLPFEFVFYGEEYDSIAICSNGWISFEPSRLYYNFRNWGMPSPLGPHTMIAPFWEDLVGRSNGQIRDSLDIFTRYDEDEGRYIIEWSRVYARTGERDHLETFELILFDPAEHETETGDGLFLMQYETVEVVDRDETNYATVGIQDWFHRRGLEITYSNLYHPAAAELEPGRAILFTTEPPDTFQVVRDDDRLQPVTFGLDDPYPNPFNSRVRIGYNLQSASIVRLTLWDVNGRLVRELLSGSAEAGRHSLILNSGKLPSGLYIIRLEAQDLISQKKLILLQ